MSNSKSSVALVNVNLGAGGSGISVQGFTIGGEGYHCNGEPSLELIIGILAQQLPGATPVDGREVRLQIVASLPDTDAPEQVETPIDTAGMTQPVGQSLLVCPHCERATGMTYHKDGQYPQKYYYHCPTCTNDVPAGCVKLTADIIQGLQNKTICPHCYWPMEKEGTGSFCTNTTTCGNVIMT